MGILEADTIKQVEMKDKIKKKYLRRTRKLLETKLFGWNLIKGINTSNVLLVRYSGAFGKWTREELRQMDQRTRKLMTMHKALHLSDDVERLYYQERSEKEDLHSQFWRIDTTPQGQHRKTRRKGWVQPSKTILTTR